MTIHTVPEQDMKKLGELIADIKIAMFTTVDKAGRLHCRPMATIQQDFKGDLWFFTKESSFRTEEIKRDPRVQLSYVSPNGHTYATLTGNGEVSQDRQKMAELWNPLYKAWFPKGLEEPDIALIKVTVQEAEYWDTPSNTVVKLLGFIKSLATGKAADDTGHHLIIAPKSAEEQPRATPTPELQAKLDVARWVGEGGNTVPTDSKKSEPKKSAAKSTVPPESKPATAKAEAKSNEKAEAKSESAKSESAKSESAKGEAPKAEHPAHEAKPPRNPIVAAAEKEKKSHKGHRKHA